MTTTPWIEPMTSYVGDTIAATAQNLVAAGLVPADEDGRELLAFCKNFTRAIGYHDEAQARDLALTLLVAITELRQPTTGYSVTDKVSIAMTRVGIDSRTAAAVLDLLEGDGELALEPFVPVTECKFCREALDASGADSTRGDVCSGDDNLQNENEVHVPAKIVTIPLELNRYGTGCSTEHVLGITSTRSHHNGRYGIGFTAPEHTSRRVHGGPVVPGPYAYVYGLAIVIDNYGGSGAERARNLAEKREHDVKVGDLIDLVWKGQTFRYRIAANSYGEVSLTEV